MPKKMDSRAQMKNSWKHIRNRQQKCIHSCTKSRNRTQLLDTDEEIKEENFDDYITYNTISESEKHGENLGENCALSDPTSVLEAMNRSE